MQFLQNQLLEWLPYDEETTEDARVMRVLWVTTSEVTLIDVFAANALPEWHEIETLTALHEAGVLRLLKHDPYAYLQKPEDEIDAKHREIRDTAYTLIEPLIASGAEMYIRKTRGPLVKQIHQQTKRAEKEVYRLLRRYWQRGQTRNALLPDYDRCGPSGTERNIQATKLGRKSAYEHQEGERKGITITPDVARRFERGVNKYYIRKKYTLRKTFRHTMNEFFNVGYEMQDGVRVPVMPPPEDLPTYRQFSYWRRTRRDAAKDQRQRLGELEYNRNHRPLLGDVNQGVATIGSICEIDATPLPIYLVSRLTNAVIEKKPKLYTSKDVKSRMIVGWTLTHENESWQAGMQALASMALPKVEQCAQYGITITEDQWPSVGMPQAIRSDGGEMEGHNADNLPASILSTQIITNPAYTPNGKPVIEQAFNMQVEEVICTLPGYVREVKPGDKYDARSEARLTLYELNQILIRYILHYNHHHRLEDYPLSEAMIKAGVEPYPIQIWHWCHANLGNQFRLYDADIVRVNLLPGAKARVTKNGIIYRKLMYTCQVAQEEEWFALAEARGGWSVKVAFDPLRADVLYLRDPRRNLLVECSLLPNTRMEPYHGKTWAEVDAYRHDRRAAATAASSQDLQSHGALHAQIEDKVSKAEQRRKLRKAQPDSESSKESEWQKARDDERQRRQNGEAPTRPGNPIAPDAEATTPDQPVMRPGEYIPRPRFTDDLPQQSDSYFSDQVDDLEEKEDHNGPDE